MFGKGLILCWELSLAERVMAEAGADGMANGTTFYTAISTLLDRSDFCQAHATIEIPHISPSMLPPPRCAGYW